MMEAGENWRMGVKMIVECEEIEGNSWGLSWKILMWIELRFLWRRKLSFEYFI
jgi:hypothetical protein